MLVANKLSFAYGPKSILEDVSVSVSPGRMLAILGPNGAGKTTLFRLLGGGLEPQHGSVVLDGQPLTEYSARNLASRRAVLAQSSNLGFNFTVREVVEMGRLPHIGSYEPREQSEIVDEAMKDADVDELADRHYMTLSGGEQQRVHLARCLAQIWPVAGSLEQRYLLLDEPTNNLDVAHQHACLREAKRMASRGVGVACILHDFNLALAYADECLVLSEGKTFASGPIHDTLNNDLFRDVFDVEGELLTAGESVVFVTKAQV
ncbi:MAG: heme ABC transporter ATP-binding protein [Verrucomicrobiota bacterium]